MITLESTRLLASTPREALEFCLQAASYQTIDSKITRIHSDIADRDHHHLEISQRIGWLRLPRQTLRASLVPWTSITYEQVGNRLALLLISYVATIDTTLAEEGSLVTHRYAIGVRSPLGPMVEKLIRRPLAVSLEDEMDELAARFNGTVAEIDRRR